jgi:cytochrome c
MKMNVRSCVACCAAAAALAGCGFASSEQSAERAAALTGGDPATGRRKLREYGCATCHAIPGVRGADGAVGPPLGGIASRMYIAGVLNNTPAELMRWIRDPPSVDPLTAMPNTGVTARDAQHIAAYLYTLD